MREPARPARWLKPVAALLASLSVQTAFAEIHALVMTISDYSNGIESLPGVARDRPHIREMAARLGIRDSQILWYEDRQLTLAGMRNAFEELDRRVQSGDQLFIFYSGHGGRGLVKEPTGEQRCAESLVSVDGQMFIDAELEKRLKALSGRASKAIVFIDACHSGGVTTRSLGTRPATLRPRFAEGVGGASACVKPVNTFTRGLTAAKPGTAMGNYVYIAASRDNEVSMDDENAGGLATASWFKCLKGEAVDLDNSGGLSAEEIRTCAQRNIDKSLQGVPGVLPHHITITGNQDIVLSLKDASAAAASVSSPVNALKDIFNGRDQRRSVTLSADNRKLKIGRDSISFTLSSRESGYVYLLMAGATDKSFDLIFPNKLDRNNFIQAGQVLKLPQQSWEIVAQGPAGKDSILAIVADSPRDFASLGMQPVGPFSEIPASGNNATNVQRVSSASAFGNSPDCNASSTATRALVVRPAKCSNAYGAALLEVEEAD